MELALAASLLFLFFENGFDAAAALMYLIDLFMAACYEACYFWRLHASIGSTFFPGLLIGLSSSGVLSCGGLC